MRFESIVCPKHGESTAYAYRTSKGGNAGKRSSRCRKCRSEDVQRDWWRIKLETVAAYGGSCECCGEANPAFLTIDHIHNDGHKDRKRGLSGWRFYQWLRKQGFPRDRYRLLCFNCNCGRRRTGVCPHKLDA